MTRLKGDSFQTHHNLILVPLQHSLNNSFTGFMQYGYRNIGADPPQASRDLGDRPSSVYSFYNK